MYRKPTAISRASKLFFTHFGSKESLLSNLRAWIQGKPDLQDIADMFGPEVREQ